MKKALTPILVVAALCSGVALNVWLKADFVTLNGDTKRWRDLQGQWVVVNYFAQWCAPCLREIPELNAFYRQNPHVALFAVSFDPLDEQQLQQMRTEYKIEFPIIAQLYASPWQTMPKTLPHTLIIDPQGKVVRELKGEQNADDLRLLISQLQGS